MKKRKQEVFLPEIVTADEINHDKRNDLNGFYIHFADINDAYQYEYSVLIICCRDLKLIN